MKKFIVKSGFINNEDENDTKGKFVERSSIEIDAESKKQAEIIATNMSLFERKKLAWDPMAGPVLHIEEVKPENTKVFDVPKNQIDALNLALKEDKKDNTKEPNKEPLKETLLGEAKEPAKEPAKDEAEGTKAKRGPGRPPKNPK